VWNGVNPSANLILYGTLGEESVKHPGTYRFTSTMGHPFPNALLLTPDADTDGGGEFTKPRPGSQCVAVTTADGGQCFIVGFTAPAVFDESNDDDPVLGLPEDNLTSGDKVYRTKGGATVILKRGGAVMIEGGAGTSITLNPLEKQWWMSFRASNFKQSVDGYMAQRGRKEPGTTKPETVHREQFLHQVGSTYDRFTIEHGDLSNSVRRSLVLEEVTIISSSEQTTVKTRERYFSDGHWIGEGPKYQWGGESADEPIVLGNALVDAMNTLMDIIKNLKVNTAWGPSTPPIPPTPIDLESLKSELGDKILSTFMFTTKEPVEF